MHKRSIVPERMRKWGLGVDYVHHIGMSSSNLFTFRRSCKTFHQSFMSIRHRTDVQLASSFQYNAVLSHLENNTTFAQWASQPFFAFFWVLHHNFWTKVWQIMPVCFHRLRQEPKFYYVHTFTMDFLGCLQLRAAS